MADTKITALTAITTVDPAADVLPIVDVSDTSMAASGTTKKITSNQILGAGGTATLASATITGDLNVSGNGAFTGTGYAALQRALIPVGENGVTSLDFRWYSTGTTYTTGARVHSSSDAAWTASSTPARLMFSTVPSGSTSLSERYRIDNAGIHTWQNVGGVAGTAMTLNSTGLGVGGSPVNKMTVTVAPGTTTSDGLRVTDSTRSIGVYQTGSAYSYLGIGANQNLIYTNGSRLDIVADSQSLFLRTGTNNYLNLDTSGNVGIGVTPSAWNTIGPVLQIEQASLVSESSNQLYLSANAYFASGNWNYINNSQASQYYQSAGSHVWRSATASTGAISFSTLMTLEASGNWIIGGTSQISSCRASITNVGGDQLAINATNTTTGQSAIKFCNAGTAQAFIWWDKSDSRLYVQNSSGGVYLASTATSWTANSDERLKDIIEPISNAVAKVGSLRSVIGKFKTDSEGTRRSFLIAQDVQSVLPEAVDASNPERLGVAYSDVIPLLVAAIKELTAEVNALKNA